MAHLVLSEVGSRFFLRTHGPGFLTWGLERVELRDSFLESEDDNVDLEALSTALDRLNSEDRQKATLVKLRYFVGMTIRQAAEARDVSHATVERWWTYSRLRLFQWIRSSAGDS